MGTAVNWRFCSHFANRHLVCYLSFLPAPILLTDTYSVIFHSYKGAHVHLREFGYCPQPPVMQSSSIPIFLPSDQWVLVPFFPSFFSFRQYWRDAVAVGCS